MKIKGQKKKKTQRKKQEKSKEKINRTWWNWLYVTIYFLIIFSTFHSGIGTAKKDSKVMPKISVDKKMKRCNFKYFIYWCKWLDKRSVTMLFSNVQGMTTASTVPHCQKGSATKIQVPFLKCMVLT